MGEIAIIHPNREKTESKTTKSIVVLLLLVSAGVVAVITVGGWSALQGAQSMSLLYIFLNLLFAFYISRWNRGLLTVAAALAIFFAVLALIAGPSWFARDKDGFDDPLLDPGMIGLLTFILVPIQALLVVFCARGFRQRWNVELEVDASELDARGRRGDPTPLSA